MCLAGFAPVVIKMKILLQKLWESKVDWDESVPETIEDVWSTWCSQLKLLSQIHFPGCYFPKLHSFSDASKDAYVGVVYLRMEELIMWH